MDKNSENKMEPRSTLVFVSEDFKVWCVMSGIQHSRDHCFLLRSETSERLAWTELRGEACTWARKRAARSGWDSYPIFGTGGLTYRVTNRFFGIRDFPYLKLGI